MNNQIRFNLKDRIVCLMLVIVIFGIYWQTLHYNLLVVDDHQFYGNPLITKGLSIEGINMIFSSFYCGYWIPLNWLSHMIDYELYGIHPFGHRFTNLIFHAGNTILLFLFFRMATGYLWRSAAIAAIFAIHPLNVESIVWVTERKNVLSTFWGLLTLVCYLRYAKKLRVSWYIASICGFALSLMSKPMLVTLPLVMFLLDYWPLCRIEDSTRRFAVQKTNLLFSFFVYISDRKRLVYEKIPFLFISIFFAVLTCVAHETQIAASEIFRVKVRIFNAFVSYNLYIFKMVWPHNLAVFYPHPGEAISMLEFAGACLTIVFLCILALWYIKSRPYVFVGWFWYMIMLTPVIGIIQVFFQAMADRHAYVPLIGLFTVIVWLAAEIVRSLRLSKITILLLFGTVMAFFMIKTYEYTLHWHDTRTLFSHTLHVTKDNYFAHMVLEGFERVIDRKKADFHLNKASAINPRYVALEYTAKGERLLNGGHLDGAIPYFRKALEVYPDHTPPLYYYGVVLAKKGQFDEAIKLLSRFIELNPNHSYAIKFRSLCIEKQGKARSNR